MINNENKDNDILLNEEELINIKKEYKTIIKNIFSTDISIVYSFIKRNLNILSKSNFFKNTESKEEIIKGCYLWLEIKKGHGEYEIIEEANWYINECSKIIIKELSDEEQIYILEITKSLNDIIDSKGCLGMVENAVRHFLIKMMHKSSKVIFTTKNYALEVLMKLKNTNDENSNEIISSYHEIDSYKIGGIRFKDFVLIRIYESILNYDENISERNRNFIENYLFNLENFTYVKFSKLAVTSLSNLCTTNLYASLFCISYGIIYVKYYKKSELGDEYLYGISEIMKGIMDVKPSNEYDEIAKKMFNMNYNEIIVRTLRGIFLILIETVSNKKNNMKITAGKILSKLSFQRNFLSKRYVLQLSKICKSLVRSKQSTLSDAGINILSYFNKKVLIHELKGSCLLNTKKKIFEKIKYDASADILYQTYFELLECEETRDIKYFPSDLLEFSKAFYYYENKKICKHFDITIDSIDDFSVADLAYHYSKCHPDRIDEVVVSSILIEGGEELIKYRNIPFYERIIKCLINMIKFITPSLKRRLSGVLKRLIYYSPYTKNSGILLNLLEHSNIEFPKKTDYFLVIIGACGNSNFKRIMTEYSWSVNKERGLIYNLRYNPELGIIYKWKLIEILNLLLCEHIEEKKAMVCAELLLYLKESIETDKQKETSDFYFSLVANNYTRLEAGIKNENKVIQRESRKLLMVATEHKAILPCFSLPLIFAYSGVSSTYIRIFETDILNNINRILDQKLELIYNLKKFTDYNMIYNIYINHSKKQKLLILLLNSIDLSPLKAYYLLVQFIKFPQKELLTIMKNIESKIHTYDINTNRLFLKILTLFLDLYYNNNSMPLKKYSLKLSNEHILFNNDSEKNEIDSLTIVVE